MSGSIAFGTLTGLLGTEAFLGEAWFHIAPSAYWDGIALFPVEYGLCRGECYGV